MKPKNARTIPDHGFVGLLRVVPVSGLKLVTTNTKLSTLSDGDNVSITINDLGFGMRHQCTDSCQSSIDGIVGKCVEASGRCLSETVATCKLSHSESVDKKLHQISRHWCASNDSSAQIIAIEVVGPFGLEERVEHGRNSMNSSALLIRDCLKRCLDIKDLSWVHNLSAVSDDSKKTKHQAKAVEQWWRATQHINRSKTHAIANKPRIIDQITTN